MYSSSSSRIGLINDFEIDSPFIVMYNKCIASVLALNVKVCYLITCLLKPLAVELLNYRFVSRIHMYTPNIHNTHNNDLDNKINN